MVLFSIYTEIETLFSFISIIKMITVCDRWYLEKPIHIVCWACMSLIQCGKVLLLASEYAYDSLLDNTKVQRSNRKALFFKYFQVRQSHCVNRHIILWTSLISIQRSVCTDQWWTACNYKASLESIVCWEVYNNLL